MWAPSASRPGQSAPPRSSAKAGLLFALLAGNPACLQTFIAGGGQTTGSVNERCDRPCGPNASCNLDGTCSCYPSYSECPLGDGGTACTDVLLDDDNCGGCGITCPYGENCLGGNCTCDLTSCTNDAGSVCTNLESDPLNCDVCGHVCATGEDCVLGECSCLASLTVAECHTDAGIVCVDLTTNPNPGGDCGIQNPGCDACGGEDGANCCGGYCSSLFESSNCGVCGNICLSGSCILGDAGTGICQCPLPYSWCGPDCVDTNRDFNHCGGCTACTPPATQCVLGNCQ